MYCPNCGNQCEGNFCPNCGTPLPSTPANNSYSESSSSSSPEKKPFYKKKRFIIPIIILFLFVLDEIWVNNNRASKPTEDAEPVLYTYTYTNRYKQTYSFTYELESCVFYERSVGTLIKEWHDNIALAEKTYGDGNTFIITDGYIERIRKNEFDNDAYYISLVQDKDSLNLIGEDEIDVYFRSDILVNDLMNYKTGDFISLVCYLEKTSLFFEYPQLTAQLILVPDFKDTKPVETVIRIDPTEESSSPSNSSEQAVAYIDADMESFLDRKVVDIIEEFGDSYIETGGTNFTYPDTICPYDFYYRGSRYPIDLMYTSGWVAGIETQTYGAQVLDAIQIGDTLIQTQNLLDPSHYQTTRDTYTDNNYEGVYIKENIIYIFSFDENNILYRAICKKTDTAPVSKKEYTLCLIQDDFETYRRGGKSYFSAFWEELQNSTGLDDYTLLQTVFNDYDNYASGIECRYPMIWNSSSDFTLMISDNIYQLYISDLKNIDLDFYNTLSNKINEIKNRLGFLP